MNCSAMQVRRIAAGELVAADVREHVAACVKCLETQREIEREKEAVRRDLPFPQFAAGVAEKLASKPRRNFTWAPLAAAAAMALMAGVLTLRPADTETVRSKGGSSAQIFVKDATGVHELSGAVPDKASLEVVLHPAGHKYVAAVVIEPGETSTLYNGPAGGPLAFEWTGKTTARVRVYFADQPIDLAKPSGEVVEIPLHR